jgi:hypothetical protein
LNHAKTSINLNPDNEEANKLLADLEKWFVIIQN